VNAGRGQLRKFFALSCREKRFFAEAFVLHLWVGLALKVLPFRRIPGVFASPQFDAQTKEEDQSRTRTCPDEVGSVGTAVGSRQSDAPTESGTQSRHTLSGRQTELIDFIRRAIQRAGRVSPWKNRCLVSSLAGRCMLRRRNIPSQISLGILKGADGRAIAHSWLMSGEIEIVEKSGDHTEMYRF